MKPERWQEVKEKLNIALELRVVEREAYLKELGAFDPELRAEIESLLSAEANAGSFLKSGPPAETFRPGVQLGDYEIISLLGAGGMGEVYRARDRKLKRDVAIKVLPAHVAADPDRLRRFQQEAEAAAALNHRNIMAIYHVGRYQDIPYFVTELLEGETLRERLLRDHALDVKTGTELGIQIGRGLAAAHEKGIIHRDLKPENIFITAHGGVRILDFGLAKLHQRQSHAVANAVTDTDSGIIVGTVGYMSPEQVRGQKADHRSDIFSLGAILYEMVSGKRPFQRETDAETMTAILKAEPPLLSDVNSNVPVALARIVHHCLEKNPSERFQSVRDIAFDLQAYLRLTDPSVNLLGPQASPRPEALPDDTEEFELHHTARLRDPLMLRLRWHWKLALMATMLIAAALTLPFLPSRYLHWKSSSQRTRMLVLPLENLSTDPVQVPFVQGMTGELTTELSRLNPNQLGVLAHSTAVHYLGRSVAQIRDDLKVDYVVEGSVLHEGDRVRINVELIQAKDETHLWANSYEEDAKDVLSLQSQVASAIAREINVQLEPSASTRSTERQSVNPDAYEAFLRGRYFWNKRGPDAVQKSIGYFQASIAKDPKYARPYAGLADAYALLGSVQSGAMPPDLAFPKARDAAMKSIQLNPELAEAHASLGYVKLVYEHDPQAAQQEFTRALQLDPSYVTAHQWLGQYYFVVGDVNRALDSVQNAYRLEPASLPVNIALTEAYYLARDYDKAIEQGRKTVELDPDSALAHFNLGRAYEFKNMHTEALSEFQLARKLSPNPATLVPIAFTLARSGRKGEAEAVLSQLTEISKKQYVPAFYFSAVYMGLQDNERALAALQRAQAEHCDYLNFLNLDPFADPLRGDPRFLRIIRR